MSLLVTNNFKEIIEDAVDFKGADFDVRHNMFSLNSSRDIIQYLNYLGMVKEIAATSKYAGILELGFMPLIMPPSFFGDALHRAILPNLKIDYYTLRARSLAGNNYVSDFPDIWVHKLDAAKLVSKAPYAITVKDVLEVVL
jgi:hypothetical protein